MRKRVTVSSVDDLRKAARKAVPGTRIEIAPGEYRGGLYLERVRGAIGRPVHIVAADPAKPPHFRGGTGLHFSGAAHLEISDLVVEGASDNGINIDDGGSYDLSAVGVVLRRITVRDIGPRGNHDGIKLSGLEDFRLEECTVELWGAGEGCGIDMVGCHQGLIERCTLRHQPAANETGAAGIQMKGGCREVTVRRCRFENAGRRGINVGGSTGLQFFRPRLRGAGPFSEAAKITVEGCTFVGGEAPFAFVGVDGAAVRFNTLYLPRKWALRVLQETRAPGFVPCRDVVFDGNLVVFETAAWAEGGVNVGPNTAPGTFRFSRNAWFCRDRPERTRDLVRLPTPERDGVYGRDPEFVTGTGGELRPGVGSPLRAFGAGAFPGRRR